MVSVVNDACVKCKSCADVCPVDAFHECDTQLVVDPIPALTAVFVFPNAPRKPSPLMTKLMRNGLNSTLNRLKSAPMQMNNSSFQDYFSKTFAPAEVFCCCQFRHSVLHISQNINLTRILT